MKRDIHHIFVDADFFEGEDDLAGKAALDAIWALFVGYWECHYDEMPQIVSKQNVSSVSRAAERTVTLVCLENREQERHSGSARSFRDLQKKKSLS